MVIVLAVSRERCVFHVDRMHVDVHVDACGQGEGGSKTRFFVDVINGWPLIDRLDELMS